MKPYVELNWHFSKINNYVVIISSEVFALTRFKGT